MPGPVTRWTPERLATLREVKAGRTWMEAAAELSQRWGEFVTVGAIRGAWVNMPAAQQSAPPSATCAVPAVPEPAAEPGRGQPSANRESRTSTQTSSAAEGSLTESARKREEERRRREASDYEPLGVDNYRLEPHGFQEDEYVANDKTRGERGESAAYAADKKQEYSRKMGEFADMLRDGDAPPDEQDKLGGYMAALAEDERRFMNRRLSRSVSIAAARDELALRRFKQAARECLSGKIEPAGMAACPRPAKPATRVVNVLLSDLHLGAWLGAKEGNPEVYGPEEESRRLAKIVAEVRDYKPQYRDRSSLNVLLDGDLIDGLLLHDMRDGAPLTEQSVAFWRYIGRALATWAQVYPSVDVWFEPGNHGRNKLRHPGRATSSKWDGEETKLAIGLSMMAERLRNVRFRGCGFDTFQAVSAVPLPGGAMLLLTHGDTEVRVKHPDSGAAANASTLNTINSTRIYGHEFQVAALGHFHTPRVQMLRSMTAIFNGALIPPNGHARTEGYINEPCGQWLWESVEGHPVGDLRFLSVGKSEDADAKLNEIIPPFRFAA